MQALSSRFVWLQRHGLAAILATALLFMSLVVIEQGKVIHSQKTLIRLLFSDSVELSAKKIKEIRDRMR